VGRSLSSEESHCSDRRKSTGRPSFLTLEICYSDTPTASLEPTDDFEPAETVTASPAQPDKQSTNISQSATPAKKPIKSRLKRQVDTAVDNLTVEIDAELDFDVGRPEIATQATAQGAEMSGRLSAILSYPSRAGHRRRLQ